VILGYWSPLLQPWHWAIIIIVPIFFLQLIHVRVYGIFFSGLTPFSLTCHVTGESEYWLSMIKVVMIVLFIIVGLIYDWGGIKHHPGPVSPTLPQTSTPENDAAFFFAPGSFQLPRRPSVHRRLLRLRPNLRLRILLLWWDRTGSHRRRGVCQTLQVSSHSYQSHVLPNRHFLSPHYSHDWVVHQSWGRFPPHSGFRRVVFYIQIIIFSTRASDPGVETADFDVAASPITVVFKRAGFGAATHVVNAVLLTAVLSATNSCFFASSRMLLSLARSGHAPRIFGRVNKRGVPVPALLYV